MKWYYWKEIIYTALVLFFIMLLFSLSAHELTHVYDDLKGGRKITEVCLLGYKKSGNSVANGWVRAHQRKQNERRSIETMEKRAGIVEYIVIFILFIVGWFRFNGIFKRGMEDQNI